MNGNKPVIISNNFIEEKNGKINVIILKFQRGKISFYHILFNKTKCAIYFSHC